MLGNGSRSFKGILVDDQVVVILIIDEFGNPKVCALLVLETLLIFIAEDGLRLSNLRLSDWLACRHRRDGLDRLDNLRWLRHVDDLLGLRHERFLRPYLNLGDFVVVRLTKFFGLGLVTKLAVNVFVVIVIVVVVVVFELVLVVLVDVVLANELALVRSVEVGRTLGLFVLIILVGVVELLSLAALDLRELTALEPCNDAGKELTDGCEEPGDSAAGRAVIAKALARLRLIGATVAWGRKRRGLDALDNLGTRGQILILDHACLGQHLKALEHRRATADRAGRLQTILVLLRLWLRLLSLMTTAEERNARGKGRLLLCGGILFFDSVLFFVVLVFIALLAGRLL